MIRYRILDNHEVDERSLYVANLVLEGVWLLFKTKPPTLRFIRESTEGELIAPATIHAMAKQGNRTIYIRADLSLDDVVYAVCHEAHHIDEFDRGAPCDESAAEDFAEGSWPEHERGKSYHELLLALHERTAWTAMIDTVKGEMALIDEEAAESAIRCLRVGKASVAVIDRLEKELGYLRRLRESLAIIRERRADEARRRYFSSIADSAAQYFEHGIYVGPRYVGMGGHRKPAGKGQIQWQTR